MTEEKAVYEVEASGTPVPGTAAADLEVPCEVYSRIVGYLRPVQAWNDAKRQEFEDRRVFDVGALTQ